MAACTSDDGEPTAGPPTAELTTTTTVATTTTAPPPAIPFPADVSQVEIGRTYEFFVTAHCGFGSLNQEIDGSHWYVAEADRVPHAFDAAMAAASKRDPQAWGISGELHYADEDTMVLSVPETGESLTYSPTQTPWACF